MDKTRVFNQDCMEGSKKDSNMSYKDLHAQLAKERELRKELLDALGQLMYSMNTTGLPWNTDSTVEQAYAKCKSLIQKING